MTGCGFIQLRVVSFYHFYHQKPGAKKVSPSKRDSGATSEIPRLPFDVDLMNWGERPKAREVVVDTERLRFWGGGAGREDETMTVPGSDSTERRIEFTGYNRGIDSYPTNTQLQFLPAARRRPTSHFSSLKS